METVKKEDLKFNSEMISNDFIHINSCGLQRFSGIYAGSARPKGRIDYHILYIAKGCCHITIDDNEIAVYENSLIFFLPNEPQFYCFHDDTDSVSYYVHFSGSFCDNILRELNLYGCKILNLSKNTHIETMFDNLVNEFNIKKPFYNQSCQGIFLGILSAAARNKYYSSSDISHNQNSLVYRICNIMHERYNENISVSQYAKMANLSYGRFMHIFTETTGISPKQYLIRIRIDRAINMLYNTDLSISQISDLVGFSDRNYFSRIFKKHTGHSPRFYR